MGWISYLPSCWTSRRCLHSAIQQSFKKSYGLSCPRVVYMDMQTQSSSFDRESGEEWKRAMEKAQLLAQYSQQLQQQLSIIRVESKSVDGWVEARYSGNQVPCSVQVDEKLLSSGDIQAISNSITEAIVGAYEASLSYSQNEMAVVAKSMERNRS
ncbi:uncharacterized protein Gasu_22580 [Galdieria sulphuraria]|uniref:Uncharacterized protein n=1 Tax=Galdieria sulphuraria TaxID=130081 RepID=M2Y3G9_GALSU|nr:uncharacterized protein Gasu_22580 [Galdieria sulphuraria]EME30349.1 hypothetical protein Gasu_22580 [Galdieria sulphuraria]|eukprot:XP_005706869.1 hypothetical protein Gasu_22580 [Galdieria sulphuraria]